MAGNRQPAEIVSDNNEKTTLFPVPIRGRSDNYNLIFSAPAIIIVCRY
jgi:hypothetical protein